MRVLKMLQIHILLAQINILSLLFRFLGHKYFGNFPKTHQNWLTFNFLLHLFYMPTIMKIQIVRLETSRLIRDSVRNLWWKLKKLHHWCLTGPKYTCGLDHHIFVFYLVVSWSIKNLWKMWIRRGGSRTAATSKMECFVIIVNSWKLW